ncbi:MAG: HEAT repeat domain-containing protein [Ignavibacterium sp.]|jgi:hypothetical protein|nr:HEAT repeat domain-containing protein [Ignavibacterium sp.]
MFYSKSIAVVLFALLSFFIFVDENSAQSSATKMKDLSENTIASLIQGLNSDNDGLQSSCAYQLGELGIEDAVIPLQRVLNNDESESVRISAALALFKIGTPKAIFSVKQAGRFDESDRVRRLSSIFYLAYLDQLEENENQIEEKGWLARKN